MNAVAYAIAPTTPEEIAERLYEAVRTLDQLPDTQRPQGYVCGMPESVPTKQDHWAGAIIEVREDGSRKLFSGSDIRTLPTPQAIDDMLPALRWLTWVDKPIFDIIRARAYYYSWARIGQRLKPRRSDKTVKKLHDDAITVIFNRLNNSVDPTPKHP